MRVQVHTHPFEAGQSGIDDAFALVPAPGFLSLVIPGFATGQHRAAPPVGVLPGRGDELDHGAVVVARHQREEQVLAVGAGSD